ncbi:DNA polymerase III subunit gamma/tau [Lysobacter xanthus]
MSYLVLARKWRPKRFAELVGQEHVVRALTNALDSGRVHHAFLFTGTRGVGKTTIARIFAKSMNCERGTSADPCGECNSCRDIDAGRFIDLLEIDAASNTGVDDVREVIDNAQYMPSRGRVKVYLIDEVHMLSKPAFNALLKTLEEPPGHVKFLLATTDPQKLPVTVLSRCLQFNLKRLDEEQIRGQMRKILEAEQIPVEEGAIRQLARAADGSLRDGLSLLDQAIAYTGSQLSDDGVAAMLGTVDHSRVGALLDALSAGDGAALMAEIEQLAEFSPDWDDVLEAVAGGLHRVQLRQLVPDAAGEVDGLDPTSLAAALAPELVQLWYQMALHGRRDLPLAPSPRAGFEMVMLRMLAFRPSGGERASAPSAAAPVRATAAPRGDAAAAARAALSRDAASDPSPAQRPPAPPVATVAAQPQAAPPWTQAAPEHVAASNSPADVAPVAAAAAADAPSPASASSPAFDGPDDWHAWVDGSLGGAAKQLASVAGYLGCTGDTLRLSLDESDEMLRTPAVLKTLVEALAPRFGTTPRVLFEVASGEVQSLRAQVERQRDARQTAASSAFESHPDVQRLVAAGGRIVPESVRPLDS